GKTPSPEFLGLAYSYLAVVDLLQGQSGQAWEHFKRAKGESPEQPQVYNSMAWYLATSTNNSIRNGAEAVKLATKSAELTQWKDAGYLDTLAAAYAEAGDFASAVKWQQQAISLIKSDSEKLPDMKKRLALFQNRQPYRSPS